MNLWGRGRGMELWEETLYEALGGEVVVWSFGRRGRGCGMDLWAPNGFDGEKN